MYKNERIANKKIYMLYSIIVYTILYILYIYNTRMLKFEMLYGNMMNINKQVDALKFKYIYFESTS